MEYKNKLNKIKAVLSMEVKLAQMMLEDGITVIEAEEFAPDFSVGIVTADGIVPMPVGEYTLEDGMILVVAVEGIIAEIKEAEAEAPEVEVEVEVAPEEVVAPEMAAEAPKAKRIVESVSKETFFAEIEKLRQEFSSIKEENEALKVENESLKVEMSSLEEGAEPMAHNPEAGIAPKQSFKISKNKTASIQDSVYNRIFSK